MTERPSRYAPEISTKTAAILFPKVLRWLEEAAPVPVEEHEAILGDIEKAIQHDDDGFQIAKELEFAGYTPDSSLVEILDDAGFARDDAHRVVVEQWVKENDIKPTRAIGDRVRVKIGWKEIVEGEITAIHEARAMYTVFCESKGHVRSGIGSHGFFVPYESVSDY